MKHLLFIDTETSGLDPEIGAILQISCRLFTDGVEDTTNSFGVYLDIPDEKIVDLGALKVNKLFNNAQYKTCRMTSKDGLAKFVQYLLKLPPNITIVGQNVNFDLNFIKVAFKEHNITNLEAIIGRNILDTKIIATFLKETGKLNTETTSLKDLAKALNIEFEESQTHDATFDTALTAKVYFKLVELMK